MKKLMDKYNTQISKNNYAKIKGQDMTPEEMIGFLEEGALFRKFRNILETAYPGEDLPYKLARGLSEITGVAYSNVLRKVNNWLKKDCGPKSREDLFQICFVLGLGEEDPSRPFDKRAGAYLLGPDEKAKKGYTLYTKQLWKEFADIRTEEALRSFFVEHGSSLGSIHETAYEKFMGLLGKLQRPAEDGEKYPMERVVDEYFQMHVPKTR